ncbi:hypothetical protein HRD49_44040 [Corallococcus exiguus]|uniref:hypothetical protein n=1 Tax=Corallococcus exiguus TaxID=83462 RepID=UPI00155F9774|nr:hypothetical protein [Corallococcus exiguus]NRD68710.1 hypothetical protein [Corallococcus exiguus]
MMTMLLSHKQYSKLMDLRALYAARPRKITMKQIIGWLQSLGFLVRNGTDVSKLVARSVEAFKEAARKPAD